MNKYAKILKQADDFEKLAIQKEAAIPIGAIIGAIMSFGPLAGQLFSEASGDLKTLVSDFEKAIDNMQEELKQCNKYDVLKKLSDDLLLLISGEIAQNPNMQRILSGITQDIQNGLIALNDAGGFASKARGVADSLGVGLLFPSEMRKAQRSLTAIATKLPAYLSEVYKMGKEQHGEQSDQVQPNSSATKGVGSNIKNIFKSIIGID